MRLCVVLGLCVLGFGCHPFEDTADHPFDEVQDSTLEDTSTSGDSAGVDTSDDTGSADSGSADSGSADTVDGGSDGEAEVSGECSEALDCAPIYGDPVCGTWACDAGVCALSCPDCSDEDGDGYGVGAGCAGPDCDDGDPNLLDAFERSCYGGPEGTAGVGQCRAGVERCVEGVRLPCTGEIRPSAEACNNLDDDCDNAADEELGTITCGLGACETTVDACSNGQVQLQCQPATSLAVLDATCDGVDDDCDGAIDEDCVAACVWVAPSASGGTSPDGTQRAPFTTISQAITYAANNPLTQSNGGILTRQVCVVGGVDCGSSYRYVEQGDLVMAEGISVYGSYERTTWTRCNNITTTVRLGAHNGVLFKDINAPTVLDGFRLERDTSSDVTTGVTLKRARQIILSNLTINDQVQASDAIYGVHLSESSQAVITQSAILGGYAGRETVGVRAIDSEVRVTDNCPDYDAQGRCEQWCPWNDLGAPSIRGLQPSNGRGTGKSAAIWLTNATGSVIERSSICSGNTDQTVGIQIDGQADGVVVRRNFIAAGSGQNFTYPVFSPGCEGDAPWIVDNKEIIAETRPGMGPGHAVHIAGACHPVIDSNVSISGAGEGSGAPQVFGIYCGTGAQCTIVGNARIVGSKQWSDSCCVPELAAGVRCEDGACALIANNGLITGETGITSFGVWLGATGTVVSNNGIRGGCLGTVTSVGMRTEGSWARLENNHISGGFCESDVNAVGLHVLEGNVPVEMDVHSNVIDGGGLQGLPCTSTGLQLESSPAQTAQRGVYRNNIFRTQACSVTSRDAVEGTDAATPRIFENNDLMPAKILYRDGTAGNLSQIDAVNGLADTQIDGNISVDPRFVGYPDNLHLDPSSKCVNAGTSAGVPAVDFDGQPRDDGAPDIGVDEQ